MSVLIAGYKVVPVPVHEGIKTIIYRATNPSSKSSAIIKTLKSEYPSLEEITRLRHEYKILEHLEIDGVIRTLGLENNQNGLALILEDFGEDSLKEFCTVNPIPVKCFLKIAIKLATTLGQLHQQNIIHKDIKPHNILINPQTLEVKLIDFSIATRLSRETAATSNPNLLEGTLAYMSPEQTGRMNRSIDYRTDFYSLGVTFYEMLASKLPFEATDPMEVVHCHIAKQPLTLQEIRPEIPQAISAIVMKLLEKNAEERYQSAFGLKADLEKCLKALEIAEIVENFTPGEVDKSGQFLIPQKLYGREKEVETLLEAFDRISTGKSEMILVSGYSGIGKTSIVNEVHKPIVRQRGYFISGKFDQFKRNIPYAAIIQAFQELIRQLLTENSPNIALWKDKILSALGQNAQVIIDVIPELELITGKQPAVAQLGPAESQNRFNRLFKKFIHVFTNKEHPLVVFLDDLQWADSASLKLIQLLVSDTETQHLLMIGAYRDNEVSPSHPLIQILNEIEKADVIINNIILQPLNNLTVNQLVAQTLNEREKSKFLAELVFNKTQGNPFFLTQMLQTLNAEKLLQFDFNEGRWIWELNKIQAIGITDYNVVELVARNIQKLSDETVQVLKLAACIGNFFNLDVLAIVNEKSVFSTADALWEALQAGLILPLSNAYKIPLFFDQQKHGSLIIEDVRVGYKFLHDRVQQAAYSLIPENEKKATHLKIGKLLLEKIPQQALEENIFDVVNQLNIGVELITSQTEKDQLANLNLIAAKKAKSATAYEAAVRYLNLGMNLLPENSWQTQYNLTFNLFSEAVESEYLNTNFEAAENLAELVLKQAKTLLDRIQIEQLKMQFYMAQNQMQLAIETGFKALELLGISLENTSLEKLPILPKIEHLEKIPTLTDPYKLAALKLLLSLIAPAYVMKPELLPTVILTMINFCIENGHSPLAAYAYAWYGLLLIGAFGDINTGYYAGQLALHLLEQFNAQSFKCKVYDLFYSGICPWKQHIKESLPGFQEGAQSGLETGDIEWTSYNSMFCCAYPLLIGEELETVEKKQNLYINLLLKLKQEAAIVYAKVWKQLTLNLQGKSTNKTHLIGENFDETIMLSQLKQTNNGLAIFAAYQAKLILSYLYKHYPQAVEASNLGAEYAGAATGLATVPTYNFYSSLALLAHYSSVNPDKQKNYLQQIEANQEKMKIWASHAPMNYQHKYHLIEAEKARIYRQTLEAIDLYDLAIAGAKENNYTQEEALANELAAEFYLSLGKEKIAKTYITDAYYGYIRWGAIAKVKDLEERYPKLIIRTSGTENFDLEATRTTNSTTGGYSQLLDLATVIKASQALSGEIVLENLLEKLMNIVLENAGASKGCLLTFQDNQWYISAECNIEKENVTVLQSLSLDAKKNLPLSVINYVEKTQQYLALDDVISETKFASDPYITVKKPKSILGLPLIYKGQLTGILYLENNLTSAVFTAERVEILKVLTAQLAISIENARLYQQEREKTQALEQSLQKLQQTQAQLVHTEKISSLGQLVAGIAHEVNNPVSFISGNLHHATEYLDNLLDHLKLYQKHLPNPPAEIQENAEDIDLEFLLEDLPKILTSMKLGTDRIREIMQSLRNFSRVDETLPKPTDIHSGIDSTLMILQHRIKAKPERPAIEIIKKYGNLPPLECYAGQLNQVFMNLLANAIDAIEMMTGDWVINNDKNSPKLPQIIIETGKKNNHIFIKIKDNGPGMTEQIKQHLFTAFYTTKPIGKGTGLGLSISHQIITEKHSGNLKCISAPGQGAEFIIELPLTPNFCP